jgi:hypothetical protein
MGFITTYQLLFQNKESQTVTINISDTTSGADPSPTYIPLTCAGAELITVNDTEDKLSRIEGKRIEFYFLSSASHHLSLFVDQTDNKWLVEVFVAANAVFSGWLVTDETKENFLPRGTYLVKLTASDNLGLLKDLPLTKPDGTNPRGRWRLADYISWCFKKTGLSLPINIVYNLKPSNLTTESAHDKVYLQAKTFEQDFNECEDCYEALDKITKACFVTQENNAWWIVRVDEMNTSGYNIFNFDTDGVLTGTTTTSFLKNIGKANSIKLIAKDAEVTLERPVLYDKLTYKFETPKEIIDNQDFSRGITFMSPVAVDMHLHIHFYANLGAFPGTGEFQETYRANDTGIYYKWTGTTYQAISGIEVPTGSAYAFDDWTVSRIGPGSISMTPYIAKIAQFGNEKARYLVLPSSGTSAQHIVTSNPVPLGKFDKFTFSVDRRLGTDISGTVPATEFAVKILLAGENGTTYTIKPDGTWATGSGQILTVFNPSNSDETEWRSISVDAAPVPVNGDLSISLYQTIFYVSYATHYSNLQFNYSPFINGSYQKYTGLHHKVSQNISTKNKLEEQIYLHDRIRPIFKGGLELKTAGGQYYATSLWYNGNAGTSGELSLASFGKYEAFEYWNQNRRIIRKFQGTLKGLDSATQLPGLLHQYTFAAPTEHSTDKTFVLLSYSQNLDTCEWTGVFAEVYDDNEGKLYTSDYELKFITGNG